jgi:hypothetical protein
MMHKLTHPSHSQDAGNGKEHRRRADLAQQHYPGGWSVDGRDFWCHVSSLSIRVLKSVLTTTFSYAIFLNALAHGLRQNTPSSPGPATPEIWAKALDSSLKSLGKYTPAQPGDRTLIDALHPFVQTLSKTGNIHEAAAAAQKGAQGTKGMKASLGRTVYVGGQGFQEVPDPGAHGLAELLLGLSEGLKK